jgi:early secretory antigenic target protein ESAT-6
MSSGEMIYNFGGIAGGAGELDGAVAQTAGLLEEGRGSLTRLAGQWESTASMSWQEAQNRWDANSNELNQALQSLALAVRDSGEYMSHVNTGIANSF